MSTPNATTVQVQGLKKHPLLWDTNVNPEAKDTMGHVVTGLTLFVQKVDSDGKLARGEDELIVWGSPESGGKATYFKVGGKYVIHPDLNDWLRMLVAAYVTPHNTRKGKGYALGVVMNATRFEAQLEALRNRKARVEATTTLNASKISNVAATVDQLYQFCLLHAAILQSITKRWPPEAGDEESTPTGEIIPQAEVAFTL